MLYTFTLSASDSHNLFEMVVDQGVPAEVAEKFRAHNPLGGLQATVVYDPEANEARVRQVFANGQCLIPSLEDY